MPASPGGRVAKPGSAAGGPGWRPVGFFGDAVYATRPWSPTTPRAVQVLVAHLRSTLAAGFAP